MKHSIMSHKNGYADASNWLGEYYYDLGIESYQNLTVHSSIYNRYLVSVVPELVNKAVDLLKAINIAKEDGNYKLREKVEYLLSDVRHP